MSTRRPHGERETGAVPDDPAPGHGGDAEAWVFETLRADCDPAGIVTATIRVPGHRHNVVTQSFLLDLEALLDQLDTGLPPLGLILTSGQSGSFFSGADIGRLETLLRAAPPDIEWICQAGRELFARLSSRPWPSVAVIDGACLGGGLEIALACDARVATSAPHTLLGFPEVKLGLMPGWGGTVLLPRLVGPGAAVEMIAAGESIDGPAALRLGLVDACVAPEAALAAARTLIHWRRADNAHMAARRRLSGPVDIDPAEREFLAATSAAVIAGRTGGHYPAPPAVLETILAGSGLPAREAAQLESKAFTRLITTPVARNLVRVFRLGERNRRDTGVAAGESPETTAPRDRPAVVGAGIMGAGIAAAHLRSGCGVSLIDIDPAALARSVPGILEEAAWDRATRRADPARAAALAGQLRTATQTSLLADADLVIESAVERTDVKLALLRDIEAVVGRSTVIATNTSTNPIARLATALEDPGRFCGLHFFNPVRRMTLVEVVRGPATTDATVAVAVAHAKRLGKCPIVVQDSPGFLVNRLLMPYLHEAVEMLREGTPATRIDRVARRFGMPLGPLELYDLIGLDTAFYAGLVLADAYGERIEASPVIPALVRAGRLGRKSGGGFYDHAGARSSRPQADASATIAPLLAPYRLPERPTTDATIADRLFLPIVLEATRVLDEGIVRDGHDVDLAMIHALGFPPFRGGLLAWADALGAAEIVRRLEPLADLGPRMQPTPALLALASSAGRFTGP
jgi:3-hydroxyacyl-CoA dehydrogenase/enoyl-CoA hydratase/3-hydroxybutyryl-CoA epimerase/3-hydroxyacyl-CoA dehydrogenase/enoyl-CoA hydratase/3-hydroxybutyryl-CoA epimerase/enoyl-CoA isomerase